MKKIFILAAIGLSLPVHSVKAQYDKLFDCDSMDGFYPKCSLAASGNELFGMASMGGTCNMGCLFKINIDGDYTKILDFDGTLHGSYPQGSLILSGDQLYGMTLDGGSIGEGCVFKINLNGTGFTSLHDFGALNDGAEPDGSPVLSGDTLFGMTMWGGLNSLGIIFRVNTDGSGYQDIFDFSGSADGSNPMGSLIVSGDMLYGMTKNGGSNDLGCVFSIHTDGSGFDKLLDFKGTDNGSQPWGSLTLFNSVLYGMTRYGGADDKGCFFSVNPDGSGFSRLLSFDGSGNGSYPKGSLAVIGDALFGMTSEGGQNDDGCIFKWVPQRSEYSYLFDFNGTENGSGPSAELIVSGHILYGTTTVGSSNNMGTIFRYVLAPTVQAGNVSFPFIGISIANISWTNGDGEKRVVFMKEGTGSITDPGNNTTYNASPDWNSKGSQLGSSGYYCIYSGNGNMASVTNLDPGTTYTVQLYEYNGNPGNEQYFLGTEIGNPASFETTSLTAIEPVSKETVQIYSDGIYLYADINNYKNNSQLAVYNLSGICVFQTDLLEEGLNQIVWDSHPGIYIVRLVLGEKQFTQKVVIDK
jgi:uncharacterized repeat protein (TIGR03803 family)